MSNNGKNKNSYLATGFTVLELIIVIIIVGVLASLALPRFFKLIERSRVTEALVNIGVIRQAMERCGALNFSHLGSNYVSYENCYLNFPFGQQNNTLSIDNPDPIPGAHFKYTASPMGSAGSWDSFRIEALRNTLDGGDNGISEIYYEVQAGPGGRISWTGSGMYEGMDYH